MIGRALGSLPSGRIVTVWIFFGSVDAAGADAKCCGTADGGGTTLDGEPADGIAGGTGAGSTTRGGVLVS